MPTNNTKERLLETATEMVWRNSYGSVSVDEICKAADVRKGSFYHYFKSKADLALACMERECDEAIGIMDRIFSPGKHPIQRVLDLSREALIHQREVQELYGQVCGCPFMTLGSEMAGHDAEGLCAKSDEVSRMFEAYYINLVRDLGAQGYLPASIDAVSRGEETYRYVVGMIMVARVQNSLVAVERDLLHGLFRIIGLRDEDVEAFLREKTPAA
ncbi:TetR/AcrR family transcriptional regulator [Kiloniella sp. b19]|uniref:TetR/AcrR family transcriptional regulator n=1 Tax=Kiloniella sp. GXU_MW_B19 TaxID=3141326 RepID=UPI0031D3B1E8